MLHQILCSREVRTVAFLALATSIFSAATQAQDTPVYFRQNCMNCHTIGGGRLTGPDLKDVTKRQKRDWLAKFMANPKGVIDSGDTYALKILEESRNVPMPTLPGLTPERLENLLDLIEAESVGKLVIGSMLPEILRPAICFKIRSSFDSICVRPVRTASIKSFSSSVP